jgi:FG-GAP-like repeat
MLRTLRLAWVVNPSQSWGGLQWRRPCRSGGGKFQLQYCEHISWDVHWCLHAGYGSPHTVGQNPFAVAVGDFNSDGHVDLAVANSDDGTVSILLGNGSGGFTQPTGTPIAVGASPRSVAIGDFNGDGHADLAVVDSGPGNNTVTILLGNGSGGFAHLYSRRSPWAVIPTPWLR